MKKLVPRDTAASAVLEALSRLSVVYQDSSLVSTSGHNRKTSGDVCAEITTEPSKWPGVTWLRALLDREKDEETPNLNILLCEAYVAIYMSLLSYALATCDPHILYRLIGQKPSPAYWAALFGGGTKTTLHVTANAAANTPLAKSPSVSIMRFSFRCYIDFIYHCTFFEIAKFSKILSKLQNFRKYFRN